jgi:histidyl-tRNA synthetase
MGGTKKKGVSRVMVELNDYHFDYLKEVLKTDESRMVMSKEALVGFHDDDINANRDIQNTIKEMEAIKETTYKGTRILLGNEKRDYINDCISTLKKAGYQEISIPILQHQEIFADKVGAENNNMMYNFTDRGERDLCLAPEYTAVIQRLAKTRYKQVKDMKLFYVQECFRGENPQRGRYRQFTQLGIEIINPSRNYSDELTLLASELISTSPVKSFEVNKSAKRGLDYYKDGLGFEIRDSQTSLQLCGGGEYDGGVGFAIGVDRVLLNLIG